LALPNFNAVLSLAAVLCLLSTSSFAAKISLSPLGDDPASALVTVEGDLEPGDHNKFRTQVGRLTKAFMVFNTAGHSLNEQTLAALDASAALIVLGSPDAAKSHYVNEEVRLFKHLARCCCCTENPLVLAPSKAGLFFRAARHCEALARHRRPHQADTLLLSVLDVNPKTPSPAPLSGAFSFRHVIQSLLIFC
jgi:hypothetical protein